MPVFISLPSLLRAARYVQIVICRVVEELKRGMSVPFSGAMKAEGYDDSLFMWGRRMSTSLTQGGVLLLDWKADGMVGEILAM